MNASHSNHQNYDRNIGEKKKAKKYKQGQLSLSLGSALVDAVNCGLPILLKIAPG